MTPLEARRWPLVLAAFALAAFALPLGAATAAQPTYSSPIALSPDEKLLWVVNPGDDSVSIIDTATKQVLKKIKVGDEPRSIAIDPANHYAVVANAASSSVTFLRILDHTPGGLEVEADTRLSPDGELITGAEPWSVVISPDGKRAFVANAGQDTITVIKPRTSAGPKLLGNANLNTAICNADDPKSHFQPRGLAVTADSSQLYTARFLSFTPKGGGGQAKDNGKIGVVCRLDIDTDSSHLVDYQPAARIKLAPQASGFAFPPDNTFPATAFPNQLQSIVIRGSRAYLPNIAASPSAPLRFSLDTFAFVNSIDGVGGRTQSDLHALDLHLGAQMPEPGKKKLFFANVWAIAFTNQSGAGHAYVVSAGSDLLVKLNVDSHGNLHFTGGATTTRYIDLNENDPANPATFGDNAGKNPRGIVINKTGTTAYVANQVSGNVSVVDLINDQVNATVRTVDLPPPGSDAETVKVGAEIFFSSRGHFDRPPGTTVSTDERLSKDGWQGCASCHFEGLTDGVVWVFGTGPRKSVPLNASFNPANRNEQRILNYSAIFDEIEDFELNIRTVSGPAPPAGAPNDPDHGLLFQDDADGGDINLAPTTINAFAVPNAGRNEFQVTLPGGAPVDALTALRDWVRRAIRTPNRPLDKTEVSGGVNPQTIVQGRVLFEQAGCQNCHGGSHWTESFKDFHSPPAPGRVSTETVPPATFGNPVPNPYLNEFLEDIGSFNIGVRGQGNTLGRNIGGAEFANAAPNAQGKLVLPDALGLDYNGDGKGDGYNVPSLLGIYNLQPFLHNGACETVACVLLDRDHRRAGNQTDVLNTPAKRNRVAAFVESIDTTTEPFD